MKLALLQHPPIWYDLQASMDKAESLIVEAAQHGAHWALFGESWLSGYPSWLDHCPAAGLWDHGPTKAVYARMVRNSPLADGPEATRLAALAAEHQIGIVIGVNERTPSGSLYNGLWTFDRKGNFANRHRKLIPTYTEKLVHTPGDGQGLQSVADGEFRIGGLICWEHWMPHSRQAMHEAGEDLHVAVWPWVHEMHQIASRSYAFEGRCVVAAVGQIMAVKDLPAELPPIEALQATPDQLLLKGGSCVVGPNGHYLMEPVFDEETTLYCEVDLAANLAERMNLDVTTNYARPDVFSFEVKRTRE